MKKYFLFVILVVCVADLLAQPANKILLQDKTANDVRVGAEQTDKYFPLLAGKTVAVIAHPASMVKNTHLVDTLLKSGMRLKKIFAPEHGFRGDEGAGEKVKSYVDKKTNMPVISLYGKNYKPRAEDLKNIQVVVFDLQDVGTRFYTYISTLHYVMEACAENKIQLVVLDRPNPNGYYVDGPILDVKFKSFSGMHPVPIVYGMTIGEYAQMINGEKWLAKSVTCNLTVIGIEKYTHNDLYQLPVKPSPNLPNMTAVYLYPSLCLFEGTIVSVGRGTDRPFQQFGYPGMPNGNSIFLPQPIKGAAENPMYNGQTCQSFFVADYGDIYIKYSGKLYLFWLMSVYNSTPDKAKFFNNYFNNLAGNADLKEQIIAGKKEEEIRKSWEPGLKSFMEIRKKYLIYKDFD